ncbi:hypothetical protein [Hahella ganghwensis]|uniref:hypothetical protein n=1 Tax=Hahella ganghwensis TaxID=286420 RepID=UPI00036FCA2A|nr:hypothetical protein [Hahella ganghwensis]
MPDRRRWTITLPLTLIAAFLIHAPVFSRAEIVVIANPQSKLSLSGEDIQKLYMAKKSFFPNGNKATIVTIDSSSKLFEEFCFKVVHQRLRQFLS